MKRKTKPKRRGDGAARTTRPAGGSKHILVVDRDASTFVLCQVALAGKDRTIETLDSAVAAITAARRQPPDLILISLQLSDASGPEVVEWLQSTRELQAVPIIALTAMADDHGRLLSNGVAAILRKPLTVATIRRAVRGIWTDTAPEATP